MYKLYTDKQETFECDLFLEGADLKQSSARIVVESEDLTLMFKGTIDDKGNCKVPIKKLKGLMSENTTGDIKLEVIAEDTLIEPWQSDFIVDTAKKVTVEVKSQSNKKVIKENKVQVSNIKQEVSKKDIDHVANIMKLLVRENITLSNLSVKKDRLNKIVATYTKYKPLEENNKKQVIKGVLKGLYKK